MIDINKQIIFWRDGASEDIEVSRELIANKRVRQGLFFLHLSLEKLIKALVCKHTNDIAPRTHNLTRLSEATSLHLDQNYMDIIAELNAFNIEGRYPDSNIIPVSQAEAFDYLKRADEVFKWLMSQL